jgi:hypothetical protein
MKKDVQERKKKKAELQKLDTKERKELRKEYKKKMAALQREQKKRQKETLTPTTAGGVRSGAGRPQSTPHKPVIVDGEDLNPRKTYTIYAAADEVPTIRYFLKVWREIRFNTNEPLEKLAKLKGDTLYKLMMGQELTFLEEKKAKNLLPKAYEIYEARLNRKE